MPKKIELYNEERQEVIRKLFEILELNNNNNKFFILHKIDSDTDKQEKILALETDIKKYFKCSRWVCFDSRREYNRKWLSFIKYLFKDMNINYITTNNKELGTIYNIIY
jgi:hypothetical protein